MHWHTYEVWHRPAMSALPGREGTQRVWRRAVLYQFRRAKVDPRLLIALIVLLVLAVGVWGWGECSRRAELARVQEERKAAAQAHRFDPNSVPGDVIPTSED